MLYGIGCDLCEVARMEKSLLGTHAAAFVQRVFGPEEQASLGFSGKAPFLPEGRGHAHRAASAAADFAAKEAFLKAVGTGLAAPFSLCEIEAIRLPSGAPKYHFSGKAAEWVTAHRLKAQLSLSHDGGMAMAFCILEQLPSEI